MMSGKMDELKLEFDKFVKDRCATDEEGNPLQGDADSGDAEDNEPAPAFVQELEDALLAPAKCGFYLTRLDIKRAAERIDESLPIKERKKMVKALFRHTTDQQFLIDAFDEFNKHINGRILIYQDLANQFPASKPIFDDNIAKAKKVSVIFDQIVKDFEGFEPTFDPMMV